MNRLRPKAAGFTLLEMILAFTILALFVLPLLEIIAASRVRVMKFTQDRLVRDLAQRKLFDRMYYIEKESSGTFQAEGHASWTWEIPFPQPMSQGQGGEGDQVLLQYTIRVRTPQGDAAGAQTGESRAAFEMTAWAFATPQYFDEAAMMGVDPGTGMPVDASGNPIGGGVIGR
jgi:type II secretory pathway pseudopilin PulG